jgi:hypothetical protein
MCRKDRKRERDGGTRANEGPLSCWTSGNQYPITGAGIVGGELMKSEKVYSHSTYVPTRVHFSLHSCVLNAAFSMSSPAPAVGRRVVGIMTAP